MNTKVQVAETNAEAQIRSTQIASSTESEMNQQTIQAQMAIAELEAQTETSRISADLQMNALDNKTAKEMQGEEIAFGRDELNAGLMEAKMTDHSATVAMMAKANALAMREANRGIQNLLSFELRTQRYSSQPTYYDGVDQQQQSVMYNKAVQLFDDVGEQYVNIAAEMPELSEEVIASDDDMEDYLV